MLEADVNCKQLILPKQIRFCMCSSKDFGLACSNGPAQAYGNVESPVTSCQTFLSKSQDCEDP